MECDTLRLIIRPLRTGDLDDFLEYKMDPVVFQYISPPKTRSEEIDAFTQRVAHWHEKNPRKFPFAVELKRTHKVIGEIVFWYRPDHQDAGEIGYVLNRKFHRCGFAQEMLEHFLKHVAQWFGVNQIFAITETENHASIRLLKNVGMTISDNVRNVKERHGETIREFIFSMNVSSLHCCRTSR